MFLLIVSMSYLLSSSILNDDNFGIMWQGIVDNNQTKMRYDDAQGYCNKLTEGGYSDWRLPTIKELQSILDINNYKPAVKKVFANSTKSDDCYMSSSLHADNFDQVWIIYYKVGNTSWYGYRNSTQCYVRCVRDRKDINPSKKIMQRKISDSDCTTYKVVTVKQLNIRDKPDKSSNVIGKLNKNEEVCIYGFSGKWGKSKDGWISGKYLEVK